MKSLWPLNCGWLLAQWHSIMPSRLVSNTTMITLNLTPGACFAVKHPFFSVWPQLESEVLKAKFIFLKPHNLELNVPYMNCEGCIWVKILFWVIWLLADVNKICTREIKFRNQDLISYIIGVIIHVNILYIIICMTSQLSSLQGSFICEYFTVWKSYAVVAYIFYIYCDLHISHKL